MKGEKHLLSLFETLYFELPTVDGCKRKRAVFTRHCHVRAVSQVSKRRLCFPVNPDVFWLRSGSQLSMLAPDGAEVAAQEWDVLVVVGVGAIGPLAAVDPGDGRF